MACAILSSPPAVIFFDCLSFFGATRPFFSFLKSLAAVRAGVEDVPLIGSTAQVSNCSPATPTQPGSLETNDEMAGV